MEKNEQNHRSILNRIATRAMLERGLWPDFSPAAKDELTGLKIPGPSDFEQIKKSGTVRELRELLWVSIDNDDSLDLDQVTAATELPEERIKVFVSIADVDSMVGIGSAIDNHARHNTTSVYTAAKIFSMLPEMLSTNLTSLNSNEDRLSLVVEMVIDKDGALGDSNVYRAIVCNHAKLAYSSVAAWLEKNAAVPEAVARVEGLAENLRLQDTAAQRIKEFRHMHGALSLETIEAKPIFSGDQMMALDIEEKNRAKEIVEDFMIAANGVTARFLSSKNYPSIRRVVSVPKRWDRIMEIAARYQFILPLIPSSKALEEFLIAQKKKDPVKFPDLSLSIIKLLGAGEYKADLPEGDLPGHFGLAVKDYGHSTAPNRRFTDLVTQRLLKAAVEGQKMPYTFNELQEIATHCTLSEDAANKVERQVEKSAAALLLASRIGEHFESIVTGASEKGTWVRLLSIPVEGKLVRGEATIDIGDRIPVKLVSVDIERGYIDFEKGV
ncbi:MAG: RNB domain-containing ribonuclease [Chloroflexi bacterium]|nr:RNB domain-containing ribonuclease [Chloroflexota bacterium]